nr:MAG TPA: head to tail adaptor [Caudoviricetes sp.]
MADDNNTEDEFDYLSTVKILLGISDESVDIILHVYLSITKNSILNYCNIKELPSALNFTLCQMTADAYRENISKNKVGSVVGSVSSISEDGRTVSFSNATEILASIEDRITRTHELNRYRKLYRI